MPTVETSSAAVSWADPFHEPLEQAHALAELLLVFLGRVRGPHRLAGLLLFDLVRDLRPRVVVVVLWIVVVIRAHVGQNGCPICRSLLFVCLGGQDKNFAALHLAAALRERPAAGLVGVSCGLTCLPCAPLGA